MSEADVGSVGTNMTDASANPGIPEGEPPFDPHITYKDNTSEKAFKLASLLKKRDRFFAPSHNSLIWMYDVETGIWKPNGIEHIQRYVANYLGMDFKQRLVGEVSAYIRYTSYDSSVTLGGSAHRVVLKNGIYNLETHEFSTEFEPDEYHISAIPVVYNPKADCPRIKKFLSEVLNSEDDRQAIIEFYGFCLWKEYTYAIVLMLLGPGDNGKSTVLRLLKAFLGSENVCGCSPQELAMNRFRAAQLHGRLANIAGDIPPKTIEYTSIIKMLTGRDLINAESKNRDPFNFENYAKLIFSGNELPASYDQTDAFHKRWRLIDFPNRFLAGNPGTDPDLIDKLTTAEEISGLLNCAIEGWKRFRNQGCLTGEKTIEEKRIDYVRRSDSIQYFALRFLEHNTQAAPVPKTELYDWYVRLCHVLGQMPASDGWFGKKLRRVLPYLSESQPREGDQRIRVWNAVGIRYDLLAEEGVESGTGGTGGTGISSTSGHDFQNTGGREENTCSSRAACATDEKAPLQVDDILNYLQKKSGFHTESGIKDFLAKAGYSLKEWKETFSMAMAHKKVSKKGKTPILYSWSDVNKISQRLQIIWKHAELESIDDPLLDKDMEKLPNKDKGFLTAQIGKKHVVQEKAGQWVMSETVKVALRGDNP